MKIILNTHKYAPELNRAILGPGVSFPTPRLTRIRDVRRVYFEKYPFRKIAVIKIYKDGEYYKTVGGQFPSYDLLKKELAKIRAYYNSEGMSLDIKLESKGR